MQNCTVKSRKKNTCLPHHHKNDKKKTEEGKMGVGWWACRQDDLPEGGLWWVHAAGDPALVRGTRER